MVAFEIGLSSSAGFLEFLSELAKALLMDALNQAVKWLVPITAILILLAVFVALLLIADRSIAFLRRMFWQRWIIASFEDRTAWGLKNAVLSNLTELAHQSSRPSSGLLAVQSPSFGTIPVLDLQYSEINVAPFVDSLPPISGFSIGMLGSGLFKFFHRKFCSGWIEGEAAVDQGQVLVRLTGWTHEGTMTTVSSLEKGSSLDAALRAVRKASFKMYFVIARAEAQRLGDQEEGVDGGELSAAPLALSPRDKEEAEAASLLEDGLDELENYLAGDQPEGLNEAHQHFSQARNRYPQVLLTHFYEALALDLLEYHDRAAFIFEHVFEEARRQGNDSLAFKARYNQAVALYRTYDWDANQAAEQMLRRLAGPVDAKRFSAEPVCALAFAASAGSNVLKPLLHSYQSDSKLGGRQREEWLRQTYENFATLLAINPRSKSWDSRATLQFQWAVSNARANFYLNSALYLDQLPKDTREGLEVPQSARGESEEETWVREAIKHYMHCQVLLPPGVESLTNLANAYVKVGDTTNAVLYARQAIKLNRRYEYGYYCLAKAYEGDSRSDRVIETLKEAVRFVEPGDRCFRAMYEQYAVELAKAAVEADSEEIPEKG